MFPVYYRMVKTIIIVSDNFQELGLGQINKTKAESCGSTLSVSVSSILQKGYIGLDKHFFFQCTIVNIFLPIIFNIYFGCSKEPSHWDGSFEYPQHMFWLRNKKSNCLFNTHKACHSLAVIDFQELGLGQINKTKAESSNILLFYGNFLPTAYFDRANLNLSKFLWELNRILMNSWPYSRQSRQLLSAYNLCKPKMQTICTQIRLALLGFIVFASMIKSRLKSI